MRMSNLQVSTSLLREKLLASERLISSEDGSVAWRELAADRQLLSLYDQCVMIRTCSQMATAKALIELEGVARRIILVPSELPDKHCRSVLQSADVEAVVLDSPWDVADEQGLPTVLISAGLHATGDEGGSAQHAQPECERPIIETEWILLTSGTTDTPKLVVHTFASLTCGIEHTEEAQNARVWSTFYDIRRYGGLQILLRAALAGSALVLSSKEETVAQFLTRASDAGVTHISGTPSHWRRALMSTHAGSIAPRYVRLSGEIADQAILDQLHQQYPQAAIGPLLLHRLRPALLSR